MRWKPFADGPDRTLMVDLQDLFEQDQPVSLEGYLLARDRYGANRVLVAFDRPAYAQSCWLPCDKVFWEMRDTASEYGSAVFTMPRFMFDNIHYLSVAFLEDRQLAAKAEREAFRRAAQKREGVRQMKRMGAARKAAKEKKRLI